MGARNLQTGRLYRPDDRDSHKVIQSTAITSAASDVQFTTLSEPNTDVFIFDLDDITLDTDDEPLVVQVGTGAGPTWVTTGTYDTAIQTLNAVAGSLNANATATNHVLITNDAANRGMGAATGECLNARIFVSKPNGANWKHVWGRSSWNQSNDGGVSSAHFAGTYTATTEITGVRVTTSATATGHMNGGRITQLAVRHRT